MNSESKDNYRLAEVIHKLSDSIGELKTQTQVSSVKIGRLEENISDIRDVLNKLSDVFNAQVILHKDIAQLNKDVLSIKVVAQKNSDDIIPIKNTIQNQLNGLKVTIKIAGFISAILYGAAGLVYNHASDYIKTLDDRLIRIESRSQATDVTVQEYIKRLEWIHPEIKNPIPRSKH